MQCSVRHIEKVYQPCDTILLQPNKFERHCKPYANSVHVSINFRLMSCCCDVQFSRRHTWQRALQHALVAFAEAPARLLLTCYVSTRLALLTAVCVYRLIVSRMQRSQSTHCSAESSATVIAHQLTCPHVVHCSYKTSQSHLPAVG